MPKRLAFASLTLPLFDFNKLTGFINEPRTIGAQLPMSF
jgi:hypothetical protein